MTLTVESNESNIFRSVYNYLSRVEYAKGGTTQKLTAHYSGLSFGIGFPDDIVALSLPHIAIENTMTDPAVLITIGKEYYSESYIYSLFGFAGGQVSHGLNELQKAQLRNDIKELFQRNILITVYDYATDTSLGTISNSPRLTLTDSRSTGYLPPIKHNTVYFGTIDEVATDGAFTSPGSLSSGTVEWSLDTGNLKVYEHIRNNFVRCEDVRAENVFRGETEVEKHRFLITLSCRLWKT